MATSTRCTDFGPKAKTNLYLKQAQQMGKSLITTNTQWMDFGLMVVSQRTTMLRVVAEQQTKTCPQVISMQQTDSGLMAVLRWTATPRVVIRP